MTKAEQEKQKRYTKKQLRAYLVDVEEQVIGSDSAYLPSVIALNELLREPNTEALLDKELKAQMCDLWIKLKSIGLQLSDPPLLFGLPEQFHSDETEVFEDEEVAEYLDDDDEPSQIETVPPQDDA